jgi:hypothetical protein
MDDPRPPDRAVTAAVPSRLCHVLEDRLRVQDGSAVEGFQGVDDDVSTTGFAHGCNLYDHDHGHGAGREPVTHITPMGGIAGQVPWHSGTRSAVGTSLNDLAVGSWTRPRWLSVAHVLPAPLPLPPREPGEAAEVERTVNAAGSVSLAGRQVLAAEILGGRRVGIRVEAATLMFYDPPPGSCSAPDPTRPPPRRSSGCCQASQGH